MASSDTQVYVDTAALASWGERLATINEAAKEDVNNFMDLVNSLEDSWRGNSASGYLNKVTSFKNSAVSCHEKMMDVKAFLNEVIETMENE